MIKKKIKFPLIMKDNIEVRTIEDLREKFDLERVMEYFSEGKLTTWLMDRYYEDEAEMIEALQGHKQDTNIAKRICEILEAPYNDEEIDMDEIEWRKQRLERLRIYTDDKDIIDKIDQIAFDQEELACLLDEDVKEIYLCKGEFTVPIAKKNITYIGIANPIIKINSKRDINFDENQIKLYDVILTSANTIMITADNSDKLTLQGNIVNLKQKTANESNGYTPNKENVYMDVVGINKYQLYNENIYYYDNVNGTLYKIEKNSTCPKEISDESMKTFKISNDKIYFLQENLNLYCIDLDGKNKKLIKEQVYEFDVDKELLYVVIRGFYTQMYSWGPEKQNSRTPYIINLKDNTTTALPYGDDPSGIRNIIALNGWLYYKYVYDGRIYRTKSNLSSKQRLTEDSIDECDSFYIHDNYLYYIYEDYDHDKRILKRIKLNGVGNKTIIEDDIQCGVSFTDKYIVFMGNNDIIYRCDIDGNNRIVLFKNCVKRVGERSFRSGSFQIIEDWLYLEDGNRDFLLCKMPIEGGDIIDIE